MVRTGFLQRLVGAGWSLRCELLSGKWINEQTRKFGFVVSKERHDDTKAFPVRFVD